MSAKTIALLFIAGRCQLPLASPFAFPVFFEAYIGEKSLYGLFYGCKDRVGLCQTEAQAKQLFRSKGGINVLPGESLDLIYQITDHLGSVRALRRGNGTVERRFDYYPFGSESRHWEWVDAVQAGGFTPAGTAEIQGGGGFDTDLTFLGARAATGRWRFGGKEIAGQKAGASALAGTLATAAGRPYLDFGARLYDPRTAAWLSQDPMAEKYYGITPYTYCTGNPVTLVDPTGEAWYIINSSGYITIFDNREGKEEDFDVLFHLQSDGSIDPHNALKVYDQSILSQLTNDSETGISSNYSDLLNVFYHAADYSNVEWGLYSSAEGHILRTDHSLGEVTEPASLAGNLIAKIHSHPETAPNTKAEYDTMGFWLSKNNYDNWGNLIPGRKLVKENETGDWQNYINQYNIWGNKALRSRVYFPQSRRVYQINYNSKPSLIQTR